MLAVIAWRFAPHGEFYAGLCIGALYGVAQWVWSDPPEYVARWKRGADGEKKTASALRKLDGHGWRAFHDRSEGRGNLDHVLVGPAGVFLLESKNLAGVLTVEDEGLTSRYPEAMRNDFAHVNLARSVLGSAALLKNRVEAETAIRTWVQAVVVVWGDFGAEPIVQKNVVYVRGDRLATWLLEQRKKLSPRNQRLIELALESELVAPSAQSIPTS
jgi:hypothetical protein